ncbi:hypothetical protein PQX77_000572 [Marasmius sp. AFHP31]|nr:hypothetical protein PQX77_000572 [Marasmius sp. AFHP31]
MHKSLLLSFFLVFLFAAFVQAQDNTSNSGSNSGSQQGSQTSGGSQTASGSGGGSQSGNAPSQTVIVTTNSDGRAQTITSNVGSASKTTESKPLPTAGSTLNAGGGATGAPSPGGQWGPDDNYIAAAQALSRSGLLVSLCGVVVGAMVMFV